ncbi:MAG TPA: hypothetical protein PK037_12095 [Saprospiraceae bacterium]|nr:hypothetical protein [Saprospiraceae bacterium]
MKIILIAAFCLHLISVYSQTETYYSGSALSRTLAYHSTMFTGLDAIYHNPAGLSAGKRQSGIDLSASQMNGFTEIIQPTIGFKFDSGNGSFGLHLSRIGSKDYALTEAGLVYSLKLHQQIWVGVRFRGKVLQIPAYGSRFLPGLDLGFLSKINSNSSWSLYISQPFLSTDGPLIKKMGRLAFGYQYTLSEKVVLMTEVEKIQNRNLGIKIGWVYQLQNQIEIRLGTEVMRKIFSFGFGWSYKQQRFLVGYEWHSALRGAISMSIQWRK